MKTLVLLLSLYSGENGPSERYSAHAAEYPSMEECLVEAEAMREFNIVVPVDPEFPMPFDGWPGMIHICHEVEVIAYGDPGDHWTLKGKSLSDQSTE